MKRKDSIPTSEPKDPKLEKIKNAYERLLFAKQHLEKFLVPDNTYMLKLAWIPSKEEHERLISNRERLLEWVIEVLGHTEEWVASYRRGGISSDEMKPEAYALPYQGNTSGDLLVLKSADVALQNYAHRLFETQTGNIPELANRIKFSSQAFGLHVYLKNTENYVLRVAFSDGHEPLENGDAGIYLHDAPDDTQVERARYSLHSNTFQVQFESFQS